MISLNYVWCTKQINMDLFYNYDIIFSRTYESARTQDVFTLATRSDTGHIHSRELKRDECKLMQQTAPSWERLFKNEWLKCMCIKNTTLSAEFPPRQSWQKYWRFSLSWSVSPAIQLDNSKAIFFFKYINIRCS